MTPTEAVTETPLVTLDDVRKNGEVRALIDGANEVTKAMGYTEHGHRHVSVVAGITKHILKTLDMPPRMVELGQIAAYLHDVGNVVNRIDHPMIGATLVFPILRDMGMPMAEIAPVLGAIGNHEEQRGVPVSVMSAALIVADKSDVHFRRVQNPLMESFDIHDRVNYAVQSSRVAMDPKAKTVELTIDIDTSFATVMEYFEIFLTRMLLCRRSAASFGYRFCLRVNGTYME